MTITRSGKQIKIPLPNLSPKTPNLSPSTPKNKTQKKSNPNKSSSTQSNNPRRRSSRLSSSSRPIVEEANGLRNDEEIRDLVNDSGNNQEIRVLEKEKIRDSGSKDSSDGSQEIRVLEKDSDGNQEIRVLEKEIKGLGSVKKKRKSTGVDSGSDKISVLEMEEEIKKKKKGFLGNLGSGSGSGSLRRSKRLMRSGDDVEEVEVKVKVKKELEFDLNFVPLSSGSVSVDEEEEEERKGVIVVCSSEEEEVGKGLDLNLGNDVDEDMAENVNENVGCSEWGGSNRKYSVEDKGKGKLSTAEGSWLSMGMEIVPVVSETTAIVPMMPEEGIEEEVADMLGKMEEMAKEDEEKQRSINKVRQRARMRKERKRWVRERAAASASAFARVQREEEEEEEDELMVNENENEVVAEPVVEQEVEDWPGPFSTAMKIIKQREKKVNVPTGGTWGACEKEPDIEWEAATEPERKRVAPKLEDMSMNLLAKHVDALSSLQGVPDVLRNKLSNVLCDSRRMDSHFMELLTSGSPTEIRLKDCSRLNEDQFSKIMTGCDTSNLTVLQLDSCGHCLPDYVLRPTLAKSPNSLPALSSISLKGACRLTDGGIKTLVASAPSLRSVNLAACPLLSSTSITYMADALGSVLKELYLDDCQNIDMTLSLPALQKFEYLEVLSLADIQTVSDDFVIKFVTLCGQNLKELDFSDCCKLTDKSLKAVGEKCSALQTLHLANLHKLTDSSLGYLANGCRLIKTLKLRGNAFSDEAVAAFLEASGEHLTDLSLNKVKKVGRLTAISLSNCSKNLLSLDLSWCRSLTDSALGRIVDSCKQLKIVKLFGCTQITSKFVNGHSNESVHIAGLQLTPILGYLNIFGHQEAPLRYSSVPPVCRESHDLQVIPLV